MFEQKKTHVKNNELKNLKKNFSGCCGWLGLRPFYVIRYCKNTATQPNFN